VTTSALPRDGRLIERSDLLLLDTREMPWEDFEGLAGGKVKVLSRDERGNAMVMLVWMPPGELPGVVLPHRHYHRTITEFTFMLSGELPHWEYASAQEPGEMVLFRRGFFMERHPGSIHGLEPGTTSASGCVLLMWRDGIGNWLSEPQAAEETVDVPYAPSSGAPAPAASDGVGAGDEPGIVLRRPDVTILDSRAMPWTPFPGLRGAQVKVLARDERGDHRVILVFMPPGLRPGVRLHRHYHRTVREFALVLSGELPHWEYEDAAQADGELVVFREGYFMDRRPGSIHGNECTVTSPTGCVILMWREGTGNWLDEPNAPQETIEVPYPAA
jgi:quercetin dioxygenase-like cupin family protein